MKTSAAPTRILFLTHYFPPEGNAPAARVHEICKRWVRDGNEVTVVTGAPSHPAGVVYDGYRNRPFQIEIVDGIRVIRVWTFIAANKGKWRRALNFASYLVTATSVALVLRRRDVVIATSPQLLCGWSGALAATLRRIPFVLEVRDIWPESIRAVGASERNPLLRLLEGVERHMYSRAVRIVTVGKGYKDQLVRRGVPPEKIDIVSNGVDREFFVATSGASSVRARYGLGDSFICAYVGTIGMAAGLEVALRAAQALGRRGRCDAKILLVGDGATREALERSARDLGLGNVIFTGRLDRSEVPAILEAADCCLVHLIRQELFESVLPSKIFEAAGMGRPIILGVRGDAAELVQSAACGICIEPDDEQQLADAIETLAADPALRTRLGDAGRRYVHEHFDRDNLSRRYLAIVRDAIDAATMAS